MSMESVPVKSLAITTAPGIWPVSTLDLKADSISEIMLPLEVAAPALSAGRVVAEAILKSGSQQPLRSKGTAEEQFGTVRNAGVRVAFVMGSVISGQPSLSQRRLLYRSCTLISEQSILAPQIYISPLTGISVLVCSGYIT